MPQLIRWINQSSGHLGHRVFRSTSPMDPQNLPAPIATVGPVVLGELAEYVEREELADGTYYYRVQPFDETGVGVVSEEQSIDVGFSAAIGDYVEGGVYAGVDIIDGVDYHVISGDADSEVAGLMWKTSDTTTAAYDPEDGLANTQAIQTAGISDHPAAEHCVNYSGGGFSDWHMPAPSQVDLMYQNLRTHPEFSDAYANDAEIWTSAAVGVDTAYCKRMQSGFQNTRLKTYTAARTRPVRRFAV